MTKFYNSLTEKWVKKTGSNFRDYLKQKKQIRDKRPLINFNEPEKFYNYITKQWVIKEGYNYSEYINKSVLKQLQSKLERGTQLRDRQHITHKEKEELNSLEDFIKKSREVVFSMDPRSKWGVQKIKTYMRNFLPPEKFPNNYYQFLTKKMMNPNIKSALDVIDRFNTEREQGLAYEALWTLLISMGFCKKFNRLEYDFYDATLKEDTQGKTTGYFKLKRVSNAEYLQFLRHTQIKGTNGKSDITLRRKSDGRWIFISCKYYKDEHGNYDVPAIYKSILKTNEECHNLIGDNYDIYIFVKNKQTALEGCNKNIKPIIKSPDGVYNILGVRDLEICFKAFQETMSKRIAYFQAISMTRGDQLKDMMWDDFQRTHIKHYFQVPTLKLKFNQIPIFNKTYNIILNNRKGCGPPQNLKIFWRTIPQFGKTYCVGMLLLEYSNLQRMFNRSQFFNAVVVVNNIDMLKHYSRSIFGGHQQFVDNFNVIEIADDTLQQKLNRKLTKPINRNKHNIIVILEEYLDAVYNLDNLRFVIFDEMDDRSKDQFQNFTASTSRIGLFLTSSFHTQKQQQEQQKKQKQKPICEYLLTWTFEDQKAFEQIVKKLPQQKALLQNHPYSQYLRMPLEKATPQDLERCLKEQLEL